MARCVPVAAAVPHADRRREYPRAAALYRTAAARCGATTATEVDRSLPRGARPRRRWNTRRTSCRRDLTQVEMRKLELARAMAAEPKLLIADEAMAGLSGSEVEGHRRAADPAERARRHHHPDRAHHDRGEERSRSGWRFWSAARRSPTAMPDDVLQQSRGGEGVSWAIASSITQRQRRLWRGARAQRRVAGRVDSGQTVVLLGTNGNGKSRR